MGVLGMLLTYDDDYNVIGTLDQIVLYEPDGVPSGILDMAAYEASGGEWTAFRRVITIDAEGKEHPARGAKVWPEWLGARAHEFRVELAGPPGGKHIAALIHKESGHRRERAAIEAAIEAVEPNDFGHRDIRHLVGGPQKHLSLDEHGERVGSKRKPSAHLPTFGRAVPLERTIVR